MAIVDRRTKIDELDLRPNAGAIAAAASEPRALNRQAMQDIERNAVRREDRIAADLADHQRAKEKLYQTTGRVALISEDLQDRTGIESKVQIVEPISRRQHNLYRLSRSRPLRWLAPKDTFDRGQYIRNERRQPNARPDPNTTQFRKQREGRAWVLDGPSVVSRRQPFADEAAHTTARGSMHRPNALIIEVPEREQGTIQSWLGGVIAHGGVPRGDENVPRVIGTGKDGKGTYFNQKGRKGLSTGFHEDHALEDLVAPGHPDDIDNQTWKIQRYTNKMLDIQDMVLNRIGDENLNEGWQAELPARRTSRPADLPPAAH